MCRLFFSERNKTSFVFFKKLILDQKTLPHTTISTNNSILTIIMYPVYLEQSPFTTAYQPHWSIDDYAQLQYMLRQEQARRQQAYALQAYREQQQQLEQRRLQKALYRLQVMTELQRQRDAEELAIRAYYEEKQRQQQKQIELLRHRRLMATAGQDRRLYEALYSDSHAGPFCNTFECQKSPVVAPSSSTTAALHHDMEDVSDSETEEDAQVDENMESLIRFIFGQQQQEQEEQEDEEEEQQQQEEEDEEPEADASEPMEAEESQEQVMTLDEFADYISKKAHELDDKEDEAMEEEEEEEGWTEVATMEEPNDTEEEMPELVNETTGSVQNLVNDILTSTRSTSEQEDDNSPFPKEDPVKLAKFEALSRIEQELDAIRQEHEDHVLHVSLDFSPSDTNRASSPDRLDATTLENREFLGYEDEIMKLLLKLDTIESDGDEDVRNERKALVKRAENMLEKLDEFKQREWERVSCSSHSDEESC
ncbi:MAG: hypothetical protein EXX96DRAFT_583336 [Benjaminiella poitrasii]|nr:MAG: hypothetical protein EXX96DRAFT_583336 [Benjaminiella poitrasii]